MEADRASLIESTCRSQGCNVGLCLSSVYSKPAKTRLEIGLPAADWVAQLFELKGDIDELPERIPKRFDKYQVFFRNS